MMAALTSQGFNIDNPNHTVILCGDAFDRGVEANQVFQFIKTLLSLNRLIWIMGNHEYMILKRLEENVFKEKKETYNTLYQIASAYSGKADLSDPEIFSCCRAAGLEDLMRQNLIPYFEKQNYVFVHGFLPKNKTEIKPDWRSIPLTSWWGAINLNGMREVMVRNIKLPGKTIVCGHSSAAFGKKDFYPYYGDGVVGIDANVYKTGFVNCLKIED